MLANLGLQKVYLNHLKSKTFCRTNFAGPKIVNQNLILIRNSKNDSRKGKDSCFKSFFGELE